MKDQDLSNLIVNTKERAKKVNDEFEKTGNLLNFLNKEIATVKQTLMSHRTINHWDSLGLLLPQRNDDSKWRRFSIADLFWINVIDSLRDFGYPIEKIKIVKSQLFSKPSKKNNLNKYILDVLTLQQDWNILIYPSGQVSFQNGLINLSNQDGQGFIRINLYEVLEKILGSKDINQVSPTLNKQEVSLLLDIRKGDFKEITIKLKNGKIERFDMKRDVDMGTNAFQRVKELIGGEEFQDITIKRQGGKIVSIEQVKKSKGDMP